MIAKEMKKEKMKLKNVLDDSFVIDYNFQVVIYLACLKKVLD